MPCGSRRRRSGSSDMFVKDMRNITVGTSTALIGLGVGMAGYKMIKSVKV